MYSLHLGRFLTQEDHAQIAKLFDREIIVSDKEPSLKSELKSPLKEIKEQLGEHHGQ